MMDPASFRAIALSFPETTEKPHFDRASFRIDVKRGKIFATLAANGETANVFLSVEEQDILLTAEPETFSKVPNKWGDKGATMVRLATCDEATLRSALSMSWLRAAPPKLHALLNI